MSINQPMMQLSKGLIRAAVKHQGARGIAAREFEGHLLGLQRQIETNLQHHATLSTEAESALGNAEAQQGTWSNMFWSWIGRGVNVPAAQANVANTARLGEELALDKVAFDGMKVKYKGAAGAGREYIQIKSQPVIDYGVKHPVVKAKFQPRKQVEVADYLQGKHDFAKDFVTTLNRRSEFVSPRSATHGKDPQASLQNYKDLLAAFDAAPEVDVNGVVQSYPRMQIAADLKENGVATKVLKNSKFRIKVQGNQNVGKFVWKNALKPEVSLDDHVHNGLITANKVHDAVTTTTPHVSHKMLRTNLLMQKRLNEKGLDLFTEADRVFTDAATEVPNKVRDLLNNHRIEVKVLRSSSNYGFRITRLNAAGVPAQKPTILPFNRQGGMEAHILNGIRVAENMATANPIPEQVSTMQKLRNKLHKPKKALLNFVG